MKTIILLTILIMSSVYANTRSHSNLTDEEKRTIHIYHNTVPSVVNVSNIKVADSFFYGKVEVPQGAGTGFVWNKDGYIVTNFHVVQGGNSFIVTFHNDKKQYKAKLIGTAPRKDIAVLKLTDKPKTLKAITVGKSSNLLVGQMSVAIGNPFGLDHSISKGIISALGRKIDGIGGVKIHNMIQTDAAINQGNSGGPLLNSSGELIGMNTMIFSTSGSSAGLGFAVPVDTISRIAPQLIEFGKVIRPALGIGILEEHKKRRFSIQEGAPITYIIPDGAADNAGLKGMMKDEFGRIYIGDIILKVNSQAVSTLDDIYHALEKYKIGDVVTITYKRKSKIKTVKVELKAL
ncbi:MAG: trypsin-like peptidase domain-containing protein [Bacteriovoracaceae bacterium]|nr:trypsin-like peptidase domain-containing protein [Bacteriovoracaceae bacterium]